MGLPDPVRTRPRATEATPEPAEGRTGLYPTVVSVKKRLLRPTVITSPVRVTVARQGRSTDLEPIPCFAGDAVVGEAGALTYNDDGDVGTGRGLDRVPHADVVTVVETAALGVPHFRGRSDAPANGLQDGLE